MVVTHQEAIDCADRMRRRLHHTFTAVPRRYDLINHVITWGLDGRWRWKAARKCLAVPPRRVLDLCCGTGGLAVNLAQLTKDGVELTGVDYSQPMLEIAAKKAKSLVKGKKISFICGDAASLPFPDAYFDCVGISFAFRNLTYKNPSLQCHLAEVLRVLSPSGRFVILETSQPKSKLVRKLFHLYLRWFVSVVGHLLSGNRGAYCYLAESTARFYTPEKLKKLLVANGFRQVFFQPVFFGVIGIHVAIK